MVQFSVQKIAEIMVQGMMKFIILVNHDFFPAYMGVFWSEATPVFSSKFCRMTRLLKTVTHSQTLLKLQKFHATGKVLKLLKFPPVGNQVSV